MEGFPKRNLLSNVVALKHDSFSQARERLEVKIQTDERGTVIILEEDGFVFKKKIIIYLYILAM